MPQQVLDPKDISSAQSRSGSEPTLLPPWIREFGHVPDFNAWFPGDLLLFATSHPNWIQRRIIQTQERIGYAPIDARWHHAAMYIGDRYLCEARPGGVRYRPVADALNHNTMIRVRRDTSLTNSQRFRVAIRALMRLSLPYSYLSALTRFLNPRRHFFTLSPRNPAVICSVLFEHAYSEVTKRVLSKRADQDIVPAELSVTDLLEDVPATWVRL